MSERNPDWWVSWVQTFLICASVWTAVGRDVGAITYLICALVVYLHGKWLKRDAEKGK